jgi:hypothetical protein
LSNHIDLVVKRNGDITEYAKDQFSIKKEIIKFSTLFLIRSLPSVNVNLPNKCNILPGGLHPDERLEGNLAREHNIPWKTRGTVAEIRIVTIPILCR